MKAHEDTRVGRRLRRSLRPYRQIQASTAGETLSFRAAHPMRPARWASLSNKSQLCTRLVPLALRF